MCLVSIIFWSLLCCLCGCNLRINCSPSFNNKITKVLPTCNHNTEIEVIRRPREFFHTWWFVFLMQIQNLELKFTLFHLSERTNAWISPSCILSIYSSRKYPNCEPTDKFLWGLSHRPWDDDAALGKNQAYCEEKFQTFVRGNHLDWLQTADHDSKMNSFEARSSSISCWLPYTSQCRELWFALLVHDR